jgi:branched-chain amino acid transport system ATP-binding protein
LLDEPSLGLAPIFVKLIFDIITRVNKEINSTVFLVEQNAYMALKIAHRGYVLENGRISMSNEASILLNDENVKKAYLGI